jgi:hypothetical protein
VTRTYEPNASYTMLTTTYTDIENHNDMNIKPDKSLYSFLKLIILSDHKFNFRSDLVSVNLLFNNSASHYNLA